MLVLNSTYGKSKEASICIAVLFFSDVELGIGYNFD